ncbi:hypothetical protein OV079_34315 [Nannocystis pusilla]|uniref:DNA ligase D polymerase domain-containing protein n=1 Tax=Nannocystis pusilla TaxID=889268 RepID=A0A9X3EUM2_9BACT|nr:hypothetical protein [Nannocystis pusilla]MCY1010553.1 hypothetical protein [Nannocystis pusilla]
MADNAPALVFLASQNCLVFHTCHVHRDSLDRPDMVIIDLDPSDDDFAKVRHGARLLRDLFPALGLVPFVKTTGSRGLHVVAPIHRELDCDGVSEFARKVAQYLVATDPARFTMDINKKKRGDRVFVDYLRNGQAQTTVAPYSARALPAPPWPSRSAGTSSTTPSSTPAAGTSATSASACGTSATCGATSTATPARSPTPARLWRIYDRRRCPSGHRADLGARRPEAPQARRLRASVARDIS